MKKFSQTISFFLIALILLPSFALAAPVCETGTAVAPAEAPGNFKEFVCLVVDGIGLLVPVVLGLAVLVFLWGLAKFILAAGDEKKVDEGKSLMLYGIIGLFVMVSVWGIVNIIYGSFFPGSISLPLFRTS